MHRPMSPTPGCFQISETSFLWLFSIFGFVCQVQSWKSSLPSHISPPSPPLSSSPSPLYKSVTGVTTWLSGQPPGTKSCLAWNKLPHFPLSVQRTHPLSHSRSSVCPNLKIPHFLDFQLKTENNEAISLWASDTNHVHFRQSLINEKVLLTYWI